MRSGLLCPPLGVTKQDGEKKKNDQPWVTKLAVFQKRRKHDRKIGVQRNGQRGRSLGRVIYSAPIGREPRGHPEKKKRLVLEGSLAGK